MRQQNSSIEWERKGKKELSCLRFKECRKGKGWGCSAKCSHGQGDARLPFPQRYLLHPCREGAQAHLMQAAVPLTPTWQLPVPREVPVVSLRSSLRSRAKGDPAERDTSKCASAACRAHKKKVGKRDSPAATCSFPATVSVPSVATQPAQPTRPFLTARGKARGGMNC